MNWYVLQTNRSKERLAQSALMQRGVRTYLPRIVQWPAPAVGSAIAPLFPGYLFVQVELDDCARVCWVPGVRSFVSLGGGRRTSTPARSSSCVDARARMV
jgi:transcription antitermination factor NusG